MIIYIYIYRILLGEAEEERTHGQHRGIQSCSALVFCLRYRGAYYFRPQDRRSSKARHRNLEADWCSKFPRKINKLYQTARRYIPGDCTVHNTVRIRYNIHLKEIRPATLHMKERTSGWLMWTGQWILWREDSHFIWTTINFKEFLYSMTAWLHVLFARKATIRKTVTEMRVWYPHASQGDKFWIYEMSWSDEQ